MQLIHNYFAYILFKKSNVLIIKIYLLQFILNFGFGVIKIGALHFRIQI